MASRPLIIASLVGASVGVPYLASRAQLMPKGANKPAAASAGFWGQSPAGATNTQPIGTSVPIAYPNTTARLDGAQFSSVQQVFRFDVTKEWVCQNWTRKSTGPTDVGLFSIRVPLVMGTQASSLAGSLTYFFNEQNKVEHISFRGRTGDAMPLIQFLTHYYQFQQVQGSVGEHVYQVQAGEGVQSELRTRPEGILRSNAPQQSIAVELEFARPGSQRMLPPRVPALQIPQAGGPPATPTTAANAESSASSTGSGVQAAASNYWDQIRYSTPAEESQVLWRRWPE